METLKKNDFTEIEFTGKIKDTGTIFDTNIKKEAEKINLKIEPKPLIVCISQGMLVKGFDKALEGKELNKKYLVELNPEESFGARNKELIKTVPLNIFREKNINPSAGMMLTLDNMLARIVTVSGGRVIVDFNNPLSGKDVIYEFTIKRKIENEDEKINSLQDFFFRKRFFFSLDGKKIIFEKEAEPFLKILGEKFSEILKKDVEIKKEVSKVKESKGKDKTEEKGKKDEEKKIEEENKKESKGKNKTKEKENKKPDDEKVEEKENKKEDK